MIKMFNDANAWLCQLIPPSFFIYFTLSVIVNHKSKSLFIYAQSVLWFNDVGIVRKCREPVCFELHIVASYDIWWWNYINIRAFTTYFTLQESCAFEWDEKRTKRAIMRWISEGRSGLFLDHSDTCAASISKTRSTPLLCDSAPVHLCLCFERPTL